MVDEHFISETVLFILTIKGFLQEISDVPFGLLFISEIQIRMWMKISESNPVWYLDCTGKILQEIPDQSDVLLLSAASHDIQNHLYIPVF